jgi:hypothetical protein
LQQNPHDDARRVKVFDPAGGDIGETGVDISLERRQAVELRAPISSCSIQARQ